MVRGLLEPDESFTYLEYSSTEIRANGKDWKVYGSPVSPRFSSIVQHDEPVNRASQSLAAGLSIMTERPRHKVIASIPVLYSCLTSFRFCRDSG
jgi:hypothetical protein